MKILLFFSALMTFNSPTTVSSHNYHPPGGYFTTTIPPPYPKDVCITPNFTQVRAGLTFVNQTTCVESICVQKALFPEWEIRKRRCHFRGVCIEPWMNVTEEETCTVMMCTESGYLYELFDRDNDCMSKKEEMKQKIAQKEESPTKCSGCEFKNACIETNKWHRFPSNGKCRRVLCKWNGKLGKERPARKWQLVGNKCIRASKKSSQRAGGR